MTNAKPKIIGFVPVRMEASRFPGKPMHPILGRPMVEHCYLRAKKYPGWTHLAVATCDREIEDFCISKGWPVVMTSNQHKRCLDRIAEAANKTAAQTSPADLPNPNDIIVCVQGDEPLLMPEMIEASIAPLLNDPTVHGTVLAMHVVDEGQWRNPDTVKIIHDQVGNVLYTTRSPVPYTKNFGPETGARRIYGIFGFRRHFLETFTKLSESPLERAEACDSNRILDHGLRQRIAPYPFVPSYSVDSPADIERVEKAMKTDPLWGTY